MQAHMKVVSGVLADIERAHFDRPLPGALESVAATFPRTFAARLVSPTRLTETSSLSAIMCIVWAESCSTRVARNLGN